MASPAGTLAYTALRHSIFCTTYLGHGQIPHTTLIYSITPNRAPVFPAHHCALVLAVYTFSSCPQRYAFAVQITSSSRRVWYSERVRSLFEYPQCFLIYRRISFEHSRSLKWDKRFLGAIFRDDELAEICRFSTNSPRLYRTKRVWSLVLLRKRLFDNVFDY